MIGSLQAGVNSLGTCSCWGEAESTPALECSPICGKTLPEGKRGLKLQFCTFPFCLRKGKVGQRA